MMRNKKKSATVSKRPKSKRVAAKKKYNFILAKREIYKKKLELEPLERTELSAIFGDGGDQIVGEHIYLLRKAKMPKSEICKILSVDARTLDRIYGTITYSDFLRHQLEEALNRDNDLTEAAPNDEVEAQELRIRKIQDKLNQILNGLTADKIFDSSLKDISAAYKELLTAFRLERGQTTNNLGVAGKIQIFSDEESRENRKKMQETEQAMQATARMLEEVNGKLKELEHKPARPKIFDRQKKPEKTKIEVVNNEKDRF
ncbi:MAG TPA: hypothetical protein ENN55_00625 [Firmicutes bacterium]|nr:hypothetical protein [Bacillota bacterium]